jgi:hypothetical protein
VIRNEEHRSDGKQNKDRFGSPPNKLIASISHNLHIASGKPSCRGRSGLHYGSFLTKPLFRFSSTVLTPFHERSTTARVAGGSYWHFLNHQSLASHPIDRSLHSRGSSCGPMRSVPHRGSGWVLRSVSHRQDQIRAASRTHPLPRCGTDLMALQHVCVVPLPNEKSQMTNRNDLVPQERRAE